MNITKEKLELAKDHKVRSLIEDIFTLNKLCFMDGKGVTEKVNEYCDAYEEAGRPKPIAKDHVGNPIFLGDRLFGLNSNANHCRNELVASVVTVNRDGWVYFMKKEDMKNYLADNAFKLSANDVRKIRQMIPNKIGLELETRLIELAKTRVKS